MLCLVFLPSLFFSRVPFFLPLFRASLLRRLLRGGTLSVPAGRRLSVFLRGEGAQSRRALFFLLAPRKRALGGKERRAGCFVYALRLSPRTTGKMSAFLSLALARVCGEGGERAGARERVGGEGDLARLCLQVASAVEENDVPTLTFIMSEQKLFFLFPSSPTSSSSSFLLLLTRSHRHRVLLHALLLGSF